MLLSYFFFNGTLGNHLEIIKEYEVDLNYFFIPIIVSATISQEDQQYTLKMITYKHWLMVLPDQVGCELLSHTM